MPDDIKADGAAAPDPITNLKSEMNRKLENFSTGLEALKASNDAIMAKLSASAAPVAQADVPAEKRVSVFENEEVFAEDVISKAEKRIEARLNQREEQTRKQQETINSLYSEFPELKQDNSEMTRLSIEKLNKLSAQEKSDPRSVKLIALEAAAELGLKPMSKRSTEEASLGGGRSGSRSSGKEKDVPETMKLFAELVDVDIDKVKKRIAKRKNAFTSWG